MRTHTPEEGIIFDHDPILGLATGNLTTANQIAPGEDSDPVQDLLAQADAHGAASGTESDAAQAAYAGALEKDPANVRAMEGLINAGLRGQMNWAELWRRARVFEKNRNKGNQPVRRPLREALNEFYSESSSAALVSSVLAEMRHSQSMVKWGASSSRGFSGCTAEEFEPPWPKLRSAS